MRIIPRSSRSLSASSPTFGNIPCDFLGVRAWYLLPQAHIPQCELRYNTSSRTKSFVNKYSVLVVVAFPRHKADKNVSCRGQFRRLQVEGPSAIISLMLLYLFDRTVDNRALVYAGAVVGTQEFDKRVFVYVLRRYRLSGFRSALDTYVLSPARFGKHDNAGVFCRFVFHTGSHNRRSRCFKSGTA